MNRKTVKYALLSSIFLCGCNGFFGSDDSNNSEKSYIELQNQANSDIEVLCQITIGTSYIANNYDDPLYIELGKNGRFEFEPDEAKINERPFYEIKAYYPDTDIEGETEEYWNAYEGKPFSISTLIVMEEDDGTLSFTFIP